MFVAVAGLINVGFDYLLIGPMGMGAAGLAAATFLPPFAHARSIFSWPQNPIRRNPGPQGMPAMH